MRCSILYISNEARLGGADQSLLDMIKAMKKREINMVVVLPENGIIENRLQELGIAYYIIPFRNGYGPIGTGSNLEQEKNFLDNYYAALQLQNIIQRENIDLIHINSSVSNVGAIAALMADIPYVWHLREVLDEHYECEFWDKEFKTTLMRYADATIAISNIVLERYKIKYAIKPVCIYNGIDIDKYKNKLGELKYDTQRNRFIITGNITKEKGQYEAIRAVELLIKEGITNIHLELIGNGEGRFLWFLKQYIYMKNLEAYISIHPFQQDLSEYRKRSQYALTTSKMEALGRCTIEAMLAGQIVIGADNGGTKEIIGTDESRGYLYKQGDYYSLAEVMKRALEELDEKKILIRENAQHYAEETFSLEKYAEKIGTLYEKVLTTYTLKNKNEEQKLLKELNIKYRGLCDKAKIYFSTKSNYENILDNWNQLKLKGIRISDFLKRCAWMRVAIYGMGNLGSRLYEELVTSGIGVSYVIDQNSELLEEVVRVKKPGEEPTEVDVIIVTVSKEEQEIVKNYKEKFSCNIIGISELLKKTIEASVRMR